VLSSADVKQRAREIGFDACGIAPATDLPELTALATWLERGYAGEMAYMHKSAETRGDIRRFLPGARSVIVTATLYNTENTPSPERQRPSGTVRVARYARGEDYHMVLAERLQLLLDWMRERHAEPFAAAAFVDKHHVQERVYAHHAGLGWLAKNTCLINPEIGSWLLLAGIATDLSLEPDAPQLDQCGECTLCLDACPTGALVDARLLDATKCISYLTIELEGPVPETQRDAIGDHLFGCDICQAVCPWNLAAPITSDGPWLPRVRRDGTAAAELWQRTDQELHTFVRRSAMTHTSLARLRRNLAILIGNCGDASRGAVLGRRGHGVKNAAHSVDAPIVRDALTWAKTRLGKSER